MASTRRRRAPRALEKERPAATGAATSATLREATPTTSAAAVLDYDLRKLRPEIDALQLSLLVCNKNRITTRKVAIHPFMFIPVTFRTAHLVPVLSFDGP